jgi:hypothetical protein
MTEHACLHEHRLATIERDIGRVSDTVQDHEVKLAAGRVEFAEIRKDFSSLTVAVERLTATMQWIGGLIITAFVVAALNLVLGIK